MANNRLYLVHKPTGTSVKLGKRMGQGYYMAVEAEKLQEFFDTCEDFDAAADPCIGFDTFELKYEMGKD